MFRGREGWTDRGTRRQPRILTMKIEIEHKEVVYSIKILKKTGMRLKRESAISMKNAQTQ